MAIETTSSSLGLPPLPYSENALEPIISARTLSFHHGKHHRSYVETLSKLIAGTELADLSFDELMTRTAGKADRVALFNNAAQAWNHTQPSASVGFRRGRAPSSRRLMPKDRPIPSCNRFVCRRVL